ncbi:hypothetical protein Tco_0554771 [Tanacetum coccineum]
MDNPNITMEDCIGIEGKKARRHGKVYNWETATFGKIWDNEDVHDLGSVETEFPAKVFNDTLTSEAALSCEPTVSSLNNDEIDFRISFDKSDDEDYTVFQKMMVDKVEYTYRFPSELSTVYTTYSLNEYSVFDTGPREEKSTNVGGEFTNLKILKCWSLETSRRLFNTNSCSINQHGESTEQISGEFLILILFNSRI